MSKLARKDFHSTLLPDVADFDCGDAEGAWCVEVSEWIRDPDGALLSMARRKTKVWLYCLPDGRLVGYGSLGTSKWEWPEFGSPLSTLFHIPFFGVAQHFRGKPDGEGEVRYSRQIMEDLIAEARAWPAGRLVTPVVTLYVDERNESAMKFYRKCGFRDFREKRLPSDTTPGKFNLGMVLPL